MGRPIHTRIGGRISETGEQMRIMAHIDAAVGVESCTVVKQTGSKRFQVESVAGPGDRTGTIYLVADDEPALGYGYLRVMSNGVDIGGGLETTTTLRAITGSTAIVARGSGYVSADTLTVVGGTQTEQAVYDVNDLSTVAGQTHADFSVFVGGDGAGGTAYVVSDTITMSDGSVITVDAIDANDDVTQFTVTSASTSGITGDNQVLTQSSTSGSGTGFTMTMETATQGVFDVTISATDGNYSVIAGAASATTTGGAGSGATITPDYGLHETVTIDVGGDEFTGTPVLQVTGGGGAGATATSTTAGGAINAITVTAPGSGYTSPPRVHTNVAGVEFADRLGANVVKTSAGNTYKMVTGTPAAGEAALDQD